MVPEASIVKIDDDIPLDTAALVGCGVTTGYGSVVRTGEVRDGDAVVVMGVGGIGMNAIQGARIAGARVIVALDPVEYKRTRAVEFGATHTAATLEEAQALVADLTRGMMADVCVVTTDPAEGAYVAQGLSLAGKRGRVVMTPLSRIHRGHPPMSANDPRLREAGPRPLLDRPTAAWTPQVAGAAQDGPAQILDELITREYTLDDVNQLCGHARRDQHPRPDPVLAGGEELSAGSRGVGQPGVAAAVDPGQDNLRSRGASGGDRLLDHRRRRPVRRRDRSRRPGASVRPSPGRR